MVLRTPIRCGRSTAVRWIIVTSDAPLQDEDAEDLLKLPAQVLRARLTSTGWREVATALTVLRDALTGESAKNVVRAVNAFDDLLPVRMRAEPGSLPVEGPPDDVAHLVHDVDTAARERLAKSVDDGRTDGR
jgi:hypothetical protein